MAESSLCVAGRFDTKEVIGTGSHCRVHRGICQLGVDRETKQEVAIKFVLPAREKLVLSREAKLSAKLSSYPGFSKMFWYGVHNCVETCVLELLGPSLLDKMMECNGRFSLKTVLQIMDQLLTEVEVLHEMQYLHLDLKPDNVLMGLQENSGFVYLIDFSLSRKYSRKHKHLAAKHANFFGNPYWASLKVLNGLNTSRQDEIETLANMALFFLSGRLPWQHIRHRHFSEKLRNLLDFRKALTIENMFVGHPPQFANVVRYARSLMHEEKPDYEMLRTQFRSLATDLGIKYDFHYDWTEARTRVDNDLSIFTNCQQNRVLASEESSLSCSLDTLPVVHSRKRAFSVDEPTESPSVTLRKITLEHVPKPPKSLKANLQTLLTGTQKACPGLLMVRRTSSDSLKRRGSATESMLKIEQESTRRCSMVEIEETTDDEDCLPVLKPHVRDKINSLKV